MATLLVGSGVCSIPCNVPPLTLLCVCVCQRAARVQVVIKQSPAWFPPCPNPPLERGACDGWMLEDKYVLDTKQRAQC